MRYVVEYLTGEFVLDNFKNDEEAIAFWIKADHENQIPIVGIFNHDTRTDLKKDKNITKKSRH